MINKWQSFFLLLPYIILNAFFAFKKNIFINNITNLLNDYKI